MGRCNMSLAPACDRKHLSEFVPFQTRSSQLLITAIVGQVFKSAYRALQASDQLSRFNAKQRKQSALSSRDTTPGV